MTIRSIVQGDVPALRAMCTPVAEYTSDLIAVLEDLRDTIVAHRGLGLSAPQIGISTRVFVVDLGDKLREFINPQVMAMTGEVTGYESCLSFPDHTLYITRPAQVHVRWQDRHGASHEMQATDMLARVICHEMDHLDGILFMDHLSDEEMFAQLLGHACYEIDEPGEPTEDDCADPLPLSETGALPDFAHAADVQMALDMLADASWKLVLAVEVLQDEAATVRNPQAYQRISTIAEELQSVVDMVEEDLAVPFQRAEPEER